LDHHDAVVFGGFGEFKVAMKLLQNQHVLVLGLGESGLAMAAWCAQFGAKVSVWDSRAEPPQALGLAQQVPSAVRLSGELGVEVLRGVQRVLKSPGLSPFDARIAPVLALAEQTGVVVQGELDLFSQALLELKLDRGYAPKVIAITGTNGKTTTTAMTAQLVARTGLRVAVAGNIGPALLEVLAAALALEAECVTEPTLSHSLCAASGREEPASSIDTTVPQEEGGGPPNHLIPPPPPGPVFTHLPQVWVLELSSFQLDGCHSFEPTVAAVLNISEDHLDWHGNMAHCVDAKARVYGQSATMVVNQDDAQVLAMVPKAVPSKTKFAKPVERDVVHFGLHAPRRAGDFGLVVENQIAWLAMADALDPTIIKRKRAGSVNEPEALHIRKLIPAEALRVRGGHNTANALAALALATSIGCPLAPMLHGLREYAGEPHRLQFVATVRGVHFYDDSKGTNVGATVAALQGLGTEIKPAQIVVILGGQGKGQDFSPLLSPVCQMVRAVATLGSDSAAIQAALERSGVPIGRHDTLEAATLWAFAQAQAGDAVLLSPACASLDMFRNYAHRGEVFVAQVQALAFEQGMLV
jgi:UDP-N-acetylmuramoylalanine--D-glutamate ligase